MNTFPEVEREKGKQTGGTQANEQAAKKEIPPEESFLLEKSIQCPVCDSKFKSKAVKSGRAVRMEPDRDMRPRFRHIDTLKYDIISCPNCGYTAMTRYFDHLSTMQIRLIREGISAKFNPPTTKEGAFYTHDEAIDKYKLALVNTMVKRGKDSEKAYACLKISWLLRGKAENMPEETEEEQKAKEAVKQEEEKFYLQAYEGFSTALANEMFPICGMDQSTMDYLLAYMSYHFGKYEIASKFLAGVLSSGTASRRMKDLALDLKDDIVRKLRKKEG